MVKQRSAGIKIPLRKRGCRTDKFSHSILYKTLTCERTVIPLRRRGCYIKNKLRACTETPLRKRGYCEIQAPVSAYRGTTALFCWLLPADPTTRAVFPLQRRGCCGTITACTHQDSAPKAWVLHRKHIITELCLRFQGDRPWVRGVGGPQYERGGMPVAHPDRRLPLPGGGEWPFIARAGQRPTTRWR